MGRILYAIEDIFDQAAFEASDTWRRQFFRKVSETSGAYADRIKYLISL